MKKIIIDPHNCSREELEELKEYLDEKCWDWKEEEPEPEESEKDSKIAYIKRVIADWGSTTTAELEAEGSPVISSIGNHPNTSVLVETFYSNGVEAVSYVDEMETGSNTIAYEDLSDDVIDEIYILIERYEADQVQTQKRISN